MALNGKRHFTISGTLLKHSGPSPQSGPCTLYDFVGLMYWSLYDSLLVECIGFYNEFEKTQSGNTFQSTLYDFFLANVLVFTMSLRKIIKWPCPLYDVFFAYCVGFYNGLENNRKVMFFERKKHNIVSLKRIATL